MKEGIVGPVVNKTPITSEQLQVKVKVVNWEMRIQLTIDSCVSVLHRDMKHARSLESTKDA